MLDPPSIPTRCDMTLPPQLERGVSCRNFTCVIQRTMILNEPLQKARQEKRRLMNDASLQIGQPIRANPSPSSVSCIEMHGSLSKLRNGPHFRPDYLARQETSEAHPACLPSTARRRSLLADRLGKMTIAVMVQTTEPLSPGTFESRPPSRRNSTRRRRSDDLDCEAQRRGRCS